MSIYGLHRAKGNRFPQAAERLDNTMEPEPDEILLNVHILNIDSNSFRQLRETCNSDERRIAETVMQIVATRGKMHNSVTNSGGMLIGTVAAVGADIRDDLKPGDTLATLVSLTLTPLTLDEIKAVHIDEAQVQVKGRALLFRNAPYARIPGDLEQRVVLSALDVCGAPRLMQVHGRTQDAILIMGAGTSGILSALAALDCGYNHVTLFEKSLQQIGQVNALGLPFKIVPCDVLTIAEYFPYRDCFDLVFDCTNIPHAEMAAIVCARPDGRILYFNTATSFTQAALGAEGIGKQVTLMIGNGFYPGHAAYTLDLLRKYPQVQGLLK